MRLNKVKGIREKVAEKGRRTKSNINVSGVPEKEKQKNETELKFYKVIQKNSSGIKRRPELHLKRGYWVPGKLPCNSQLEGIL